MSPESHEPDNLNESLTPHPINTNSFTSHELILNLEEGVELIINKLALREAIILDLFGGQFSQVPNAINIDIIADSGIRASVADLLTKLPKNSIDEIIASNPQADFIEQAAIALKLGGRIYINATKGNPFGRLPNSEILERLKLIVIQVNSPLAPRFAHQKFSRQTPRSDGTLDIPIFSIKTTILEKIK
ncbi:MAG: hypothetical protein HC942_06960 [Microcoleus sp. SU_5_6]|nr:hypothetical protein [Microcoleus sp. SU_5_6]NJS12367.1 hypothetical protein [Microcoleus sp. CSU_2_2]